MVPLSGWINGCVVERIVPCVILDLNVTLKLTPSARKMILVSFLRGVSGCNFSIDIGKLIGTGLVTSDTLLDWLLVRYGTEGNMFQRLFNGY